MVTLKSARELEAMARAGDILARTLARLREQVRARHHHRGPRRRGRGVHPQPQGRRPSFKGLYGFPKTLCVSIDEEIVHGIPSSTRVLEEGSIISIDCGVLLEGLHADSATTVPVGRISAEAQRLLDVTSRCLDAGLAAAVVGNHIGDIGHAVQTVAEAAGFGVVRELVGHGIGTRFHEDPQVPNYGSPKRGRACRWA
jgi:methionyl aminopeptidase